MLYKVIGLMSGSSLDGLDMAYVHLEERRGEWTFSIETVECLPYNEDLRKNLRDAAQLSVGDFLELHTAYGHFTGKAIEQFIERNSLAHRVDFIASHGHTVYHRPAGRTTFQLGDGAAIAAETGLPTISDLRALDVALGGQGAPIVPIGDSLLFPGYDYWLNLGGIANITTKKDGHFIAWDICPCNQLLDFFAAQKGLAYDKDGVLAASGKVNAQLLKGISGFAYYQQAPPKSLDNHFAKLVTGVLNQQQYSTEDALATAVAHIVQQVAGAVKPYIIPGTPKLLCTGGGALNRFLIQQLRDSLAQNDIEMVVPDAQVIQYKEALVMALIGVLRWREEDNVLASVTGARTGSIGGALWMGATGSAS